MDEYLGKLKDASQKAVEFLNGELGGIHTGRASVNLISDVMVEAYGTKTPLKQIANITVTDPRSMAVQPWDKGNLVQIETALRDSGLGFGVVNSGDAVRVSIPELTEDRRNEYVKMAKEKAEEAKVSIRNARRDLWEETKTEKTRGDISEDEMYRREGEINKFVEAKNAEIEQILAGKEKELKEV